MQCLWIKPVLNYHPGNWSCIFSISENHGRPKTSLWQRTPKSPHSVLSFITWPSFYFKTLFWFEQISLCLEKVSWTHINLPLSSYLFFFPLWAISPFLTFLLSIMQAFFTLLPCLPFPSVIPNRGQPSSIQNWNSEW